MFKKVVSNLAFSPTAIDQVAFYSQRLKKEESIRRLGLILIVFSMFIQVFAAMIPPEKSMAASNNDVIGKITSTEQLLGAYKDKADVRALYNRFGLENTNINDKGASNVKFNFNKEGQRGTRTVGRTNFASTKDHNLGNFAGSTFYSRNAGEWSGSADAYYFGRQKGTDQKYYEVWVIKDCGNIAYRLMEGTPEIEITPGPTLQLPPTPTPTPPTVTLTPAPTPAPQPMPSPKPLPIPPAPTPPPTPEPVCENNPALKPDDERCKCIENPNIPATDEKCTTPARSKTAKNISQNLSEPLTLATPAKAGNVIEYTLTTTNKNIVEKTNYTVEDYVGDLLDYADVDTSFLATQGGVFVPDSKKIIWENQTIPARGDLKKTFRVTLKSTIPSTNQPNATATDYDCKMQNGYGNDIVVMVDCPVLKTVETLPNTGPGTTITAAFFVSVLSGYFFMRSRLLAKEVGIIKKSHQLGY